MNVFEMQYLDVQKCSSVARQPRCCVKMPNTDIGPANRCEELSKHALNGLNCELRPSSAGLYYLTVYIMNIYCKCSAHITSISHVLLAKNWPM